MLGKAAAGEEVEALSSLSAVPTLLVETSQAPRMVALTGKDLRGVGGALKHKAPASTNSSKGQSYFSCLHVAGSQGGLIVDKGVKRHQPSPQQSGGRFPSMLGC